ncbi:CHAT domain-containing protein [Micromonospora sp. Llam0]|uniref:CHAT domain-containing protein n=1 Tax=Micromonospora sp. Llam0 TaxID=2485143 RepID=UPI0013159E03|nr:CHAT domain-containing protein [Micromonospora sp. Llam0]
MSALRERISSDTSYAQDLEALATLTEGMALGATGRVADLIEAVPRLTRIQGPPGIANAVFSLLARAYADGHVRDRDLARLRWRAVTGQLTGPERAGLLGSLAMVNLLQAMDSPARLSVAVLDLRRAVQESPPGDIHRVLYLTQLGDALLQRAVAIVGAPTRLGRWLLRPSLRLLLRPGAGAAVDVEEAILVSREAVGTAQWPGHAFWSMAAVTLGSAYRLAGRFAEAREVGLRSLQGHAWRALLQSDTAARTSAVRYAALDSMTVAGWHIMDGDADGAAVALDACRGLILHAATEFADVPTQLDAAGATDLAAQWRAHPGPLDQIPIDLRQAALQQLTADGRLLDPPSPAEVRAALTAIGADALVYLVPADSHPAVAVIVPSTGAGTILPLPQLTTAPADASGQFDADTEREVDVDRELDSSVPPDRLGALCDWAWAAATGPLLDYLGMPDPRVVLVPMGGLGAVPWHAARHVVDGRYQYAIERAVFSYAASARMLCRTARSADVSPASGSPANEFEPALVVGDPDTGGAAPALPAARDEALTVAEFYRDVTYIGRLADGTPSPSGGGTPEEVLGWLAGGTAATGGMLHLACHGVVVDGTGPQDTSYLLLSDGRRLAAEQLVAALSDPAVRRPALVVLAACNSGVSGRGADEAFSLSTMFLAGGARSVVAAHWALPDRSTSDLMVLFHRHLRVDGLAPADALRAAQLHLLDRDVAEWAGVVHYGQ